MPVYDPSMRPAFPRCCQKRNDSFPRLPLALDRVSSIPFALPLQVCASPVVIRTQFAASAVPQNAVAFAMSPGIAKYLSRNVCVAVAQRLYSVLTARSSAARISACPPRIPPVNKPRMTSTMESSTREKPDCAERAIMQSQQYTMAEHKRNKILADRYSRRR